MAHQLPKTAGMTRLAHRVPNVRRRSWATGRLAVSRVDDDPAALPIFEPASQRIAEGEVPRRLVQLEHPAPPLALRGPQKELGKVGVMGISSSWPTSAPPP